MFKNIVVAGYPKSGNTYLAQLVASLLTCPIAGFFEQPNNDEISKNTDSILEKSQFRVYKAHQRSNALRHSKIKIHKIIYIVRDPRDVAVSMAHFFNQPKHQSKYRAGIKEPIEEMILTLIHGGLLPWTQTKWTDHVISYLSPANDKLIVRYEDLIHDPIKSLKKISHFLELEKKDDELISIIKRHDISTLKKKAQEENEQRKLRYLRNGNAGEYINTLTENQIQLIERYCHSVMAIFNYETKSNNPRTSNLLKNKNFYKKDKYILCRPQGGLNDMLCQIEKCCQYAEKNNRLVIVDSNYWCSNNFKDEFDKYFYSKQSKLFLSIRNFSNVLEDMSVYPNNLMGKIQTYDAYYNLDKKSFCDKLSDNPLTFDFNKSYQEDVLLHHTGGGGNLSRDMVLRLGLDKNLVKELFTRVQHIGGGWIGVHVRNTDYESNYQELINVLKNQKFEKLFLATDSAEVLNSFKVSLSNRKVYSFANYLSQDGSPIHKNIGDKTDVFNRNQDAILDLIMLALSKKIYFTQIKKTQTSGNYSGFSILAHNLWRSKVHLNYLLNINGLNIGLD